MDFIKLIRFLHFLRTYYSIYAIVCAFHVNPRSNTTPKYLNSFEIGRLIPPIVREGGDSTGLFEKRTTSPPQTSSYLWKGPNWIKKTLTASSDFWRLANSLDNKSRGIYNKVIGILHTTLLSPFGHQFLTLQHYRGADLKQNHVEDP
jgi:hypothetical protein